MKFCTNIEKGVNDEFSIISAKKKVLRNKTIFYKKQNDFQIFFKSQFLRILLKQLN